MMNTKKYAEETLHILGEYFVKNNIRFKENVTFERFAIETVKGLWEMTEKWGEPYGQQSTSSHVSKVQGYDH